MRGERRWRSLPRRIMSLSRFLVPATEQSPSQERVGEVLAEVRSVEVRAARMLTDVLSGGYRSTFRGMGVEFSDVREYVEGDDPRSVDWNVTARVGRPFVKRFVEERERTLVFVLDLSPSMAEGLGAYSLRQAAGRYCAMLGLVAIQNQDRVGLVVGGAEGPRYVVPQSGGRHVLRVLSDCVQMPCGQISAGTGSAGGSDLAELLNTVNARVRRRAVVFVLSDFSTPGYEHALRLSRRHHDVVAVRFLPRERFAPPRRLMAVRPPGVVGGGPMHLYDFASDAFRSEWLARCAHWHRQHDELLGRSRIDGIDVELPLNPDIRELAQPLLAFFRRRQRREAGR